MSNRQRPLGSKVNDEDTAVVDTAVSGTNDFQTSLVTIGQNQQSNTLHHVRQDFIQFGNSLLNFAAECMFPISEHLQFTENQGQSVRSCDLKHEFHNADVSNHLSQASSSSKKPNEQECTLN